MLSSKKQYLSDTAKQEYSTDSGKLESLQSKFNKLCAAWGAQPDSELTRTIQPLLQKVKVTPLFMAVVMDDHEFIGQNCGDDNFLQSELLSLSFACGSRDTAELLLDKLSKRITDNERYHLHMIHSIASSGNFAWLKDVLSVLGHQKVPYSCNSFVPYSRRQELSALDNELSTTSQSLANTIVDAHPEILTLDGQAQEQFMQALAAKMGCAVTVSPGTPDISTPPIDAR